jgi:hypothetical protein
MEKRDPISLAELRQAQDRVMSAGELVAVGPAALQWAVQFAREDLGSLRSGDLLNVRGELLAFSFFNPHQSSRNRPRSETPQGSVGLPTFEETRKSQERFYEILEPFIARGEVTVRPMSLTYRLVRHDRIRGRRAKTLTDTFFPISLQGLPKERLVSLIPFVRERSFSHMPLGVEVLIQLLAAHGKLVETCPECGRWFVAGRTNQAYCSGRCVSRKTTRAHRERMRARGRSSRQRKTHAR